MRSGEFFEYIYGMIVISEGLLLNELVCRVKGLTDQIQSFMMKIQSQWVEGPLNDWIVTNEKDQQLRTKERYKALIGWFYSQV